ncbi:MAG: penicillin-binding transpeptidase domain-containing protein, partial [Actinobacteria bacterium]|nr:penicillin-binding transpeptidase domain-containing protein [Actinomycetota bacterium]
APSRRVFSTQTAVELKMMFRKVVAEGTGTLAQVPGYSVAGKTGTSQIPTPNFSNYIKGAYNATFVGMAPAENPVLTTIVVIQRPTPVIFGGAIAAPVFSQIMSYGLHHYHIPPTMQDNQGSAKAGSSSVLAQDIT